MCMRICVYAWYYMGKSMSRSELLQADDDDVLATQIHLQGFESWSY